MSASAAAMARAMSISGRPLNGAGTMVTSPNGTGGSIRNVTRRAPIKISNGTEGAFLTHHFYSSSNGRFAEVTEAFRPIGRITARPDDRRAIIDPSFAIRLLSSDQSGCPIVTVSLPTPSTSHSILSPATVAATPDGVPVMMMSPGASSTISDNFEMISGTFQII